MASREEPARGVPDLDAVLASPPPRLSPAGALAAARALFGVDAASASDLGSERDRTFLLADADGQSRSVLKVSNTFEDSAVLDMEAAAALHVKAADPGLQVAIPWRAIDPHRQELPGPASVGDEPADLRAEWQDGGDSHWCRLYDAVPGHRRVDATTLSDAAVAAWGETAARVGVALRGFTPPQAIHREMLWDVRNAPAVRPMTAAIRDPSQRALVERVLDEFERTALPAWPRLRAQVIHTDLTVDNSVTDDAGRIVGIVDFGDMSYSALVTDIGSVLDSLGSGRSGDELFRLARLVIDGYQRVVDLEDLELGLLGLLWATRSAITIAIKSWRVSNGLEAAAAGERFNAPCATMVRTLLEAGWGEVARRLAGPAASADAPDLADRRSAAFGPTIEPLFYDVPLRVAAADGVWITDVDGTRYLDAYNNVPCVGHGHPRVRAAIARQSRRINTHTRYLHPTAIELAERLTASCPDGLDSVLLVNSGSEANDLAWRIATAVTGARGGLCTATAYHGITEATAALSPETSAGLPAPTHVETWEPPDSYRGEHLDAAGFAAALARLRDRGLGPAASILDGLITSDRIADLEPGYVRELVHLTHQAGGLWIADEVQAGHARTGDTLWAFERFGVVPDFVTLGKPMGNGHPVAAVITRRRLLEELAGRTTLFSTFGGNPVSAAASLAVLDVLEDERVLDRVRDAGDALRSALTELAERHPAIGDVRVIGLACGIELVIDRSTAVPDVARARAVKDRLRHRGVLVGTTGRDGAILKIRPPLAFGAEHVPILVEALDGALSDTAGGGAR